MKIIFIHPTPFDAVDSGSKLRPAKMLESFSSKGYDVSKIIGTKLEIEHSINLLRERINHGEMFDYVYVESLSMPTNLRIAKFLGQSFYKPDFAVFKFIQFCISKNIPIGYYLRDIHWDFPEIYKSESFVRRLYFKLMLRSFGRKEVHFLNQKGISLFTPSVRFGEYISEKWGVRSSPLYPGADIENTEPRKIASPLLNLFYVGGVVGMYEMDVFLKGFSDSHRTNLTVCVRKHEKYALGAYQSLNNLQIVHGSGSDLIPYYKEAHIAIYPLRPIGYVNLAFSVKISEYIGHGLPIIIFKGSEVADFVEKVDIGWVIPFDSKSVTDLLHHIHSNRNEYEEKQKNVLKIQNEFSWLKVVERLEQKIIAP